MIYCSCFHSNQLNLHDCIWAKNVYFTLDKRTCTLCLSNVKGLKVFLAWKKGTHASKRSLLEAKEVGGCAVQETHNDVNGRHCPWVREVIEDLLIPKIESNV